MGYADLLKKWATSHSDVEAVKQGNKVYTYKKLNKRANQLACALLDAGVRKGEKFGALLYNSPEFLEIMFGLQKIGAIPVPINFRYGFTEFEYIYKNSDITGLFIEKRFVNNTRNFFKTRKITSIRHTFVVDAPSDQEFSDMYNYEKFIKDKDETDPDIQIDDEEPAFILYTGGTTGYPKGVIYTHSNLYAATYLTPGHGAKLIAEKKIPESTLIPSSGLKMKFLIPTPIFHISGILTIITQIGLGSFIVFPVNSSFDPEEICQIIQDEKITTIFMVPTMYRMWLNYPDLDKFDFSSLTVLGSGGAKMPREMKIEILEKFPKVTLVDGYGSTETVGTSTIAFMTYEDIPKIKQGYIGQLVTGMEMRVVDENMRDVPIGEVGEMIFKGKNVMKGYYKDPWKTERTIENNGWLHSGDLCRMDKEGNIYYVGRISEMITSGGEKIYPMEIEDYLKTHPKIQDVAVTGVPDKVWGELVTALIELKPGKDMTPEEVIEYCKDNIASYKKPRIIKFVNRVPLTEVGKPHRAEIKNLALSLMGAEFPEVAEKIVIDRVVMREVEEEAGSKAVLDQQRKDRLPRSNR